MVEPPFQPGLIVIAQFFELVLESFVYVPDPILRFFRFRIAFFSLVQSDFRRQEIVHHRRHQRSRKKIRREHREDNRHRQRSKQIFCRSG